MSQNNLTRVLFGFKSDEIKALIAKRQVVEKQNSQKSTYYYVQWTHGTFKDGWYNQLCLSQPNPNVLQTKFSKDQRERYEEDPELRSNSSFSQSTEPHKLCEWDCGHHGSGDVEVTRDHAIPKRHHDQAKALKAAGFYDLGSDITNRSTNCIFVCPWRHGLMDSYPPQSIMIPTSEALQLMLSSIQQIDPRSDGRKVGEQLQKMKQQLKEMHCAVTRYELNSLPEKLGRTPEDFDDVTLQFCNAFNVAIKAARQCSGLTALDGAKWPPGNDFKERSKLCQDAIDLFYSKTYEWLEYHTSRRSSYDDMLSRIDDVKAETEKLQDSFDARYDTLNKSILQHLSPTQETPDGGSVHDVTTSKALSDDPEKNEEDTVFEGDSRLIFDTSVQDLWLRGRSGKMNREERQLLVRKLFAQCYTKTGDTVGNGTPMASPDPQVVSWLDGLPNTYNTPEGQEPASSRLGGNDQSVYTDGEFDCIFTDLPS